MPRFLADAIRARLDQRPARHLDPALERVLLAVVDKCEQMRAESARHPGGVGHFFADEFEALIARELGIEI